jgi:predicted O-methyltransferase YrrM
MGRLLALAIGALVAWRFLARRSRPEESVEVGWADGSSAMLAPGVPERERLVEIGRSVADARQSGE